jgi:phage terminase Nu1 subunit (DNA packaging protein)
MLSSESPTDEPAVLNLGELASILRISRKTLNAWLERWSDFPILSRGTNGQKYEFDAVAVFGFLRAKRGEQLAGSAARDQALAQLALPFEADGNSAGTELSVREQIDAARLRRLVREENEARALLIDVAEVARGLVSFRQELQANLSDFVRQIGIDHNLPSAVLLSMQSGFDASLHAFAIEVSRLQPSRGKIDAP